MMKKFWPLLLVLLLTSLSYADITPLPDPPSRTSPSTFAAKADAFLGALPAFATEANQLASDVNDDEVAAAASAAAALGYSNIALSSANFAGDWDDQAGAAAPPYAVWHAGNYWQLVSAVLDVSATEPGQTADWRVIGDKITVSTIADLRLISGVGVSSAYILGHSSANDGGQGVFYWDADSVLSDNGGTIIAVTGVATGRWIRSFSGPLYIEYFGGGTASLDNSTYLQAAYNAGYRHFKFGVGTYTFTSGFSFTDPVFIEGSGSKSLDHPNYGTTIYYTGSGDFISIDLATTRRGGKISNVRIEATNTANKIVKLVDCWRFEVDHCDIVGGGYGFYVDGSSFALMLHNSVVQSYNIAGLYCGTQTTDITVDTCDFGGNVDSTAWGIITNGVNTKITKSWFEVGPGTRPTGSGGHIWQPSTAPLNAGCTITQNEFGRVGTNASNHIRIEGGQYSVITGNTFVGNTSPTSSLIYYDLSVVYIGYRSSMVSQNKFMNFVSPAIQVNLGVIDISHNDFFTTDTLLTGTYFINDAYNTSSKIRVIGNNFACDASSAIYAVKGCGTTETPQIVSFNDNNIYNMGGSEGYVSIANGNRIDGGASKLAVGINVRDGAITGNRIRNCSKAIMARNCTVVGNYLDGNTVTIEPYTADGLYPLIANNSGDIQTVTASGETITRYGITYIDTTSGALTGAIGNGYRPGDIKLFSVLTYNGNYTLTVNNHEGAGAATFVFGSATASLSLMWDGATWVTLRDGTGL